MNSTEARCPGTGKVQYERYNDVAREARAYQRRFRDGTVRAYRCTHCDLCHFGHVKKHR